MTERPIIFSGPMVRAIRDGRKTQTRRVLKEPPWAAPGTLDVVDGDPWAVDPTQGGDRPIVWPYLPRDILWVRETHKQFARNGMPTPDLMYADDEDYDIVEDALGWRTVPSIHMPRWAARLFLSVTAVRVERLQEITPEDAVAEGFGFLGCLAFGREGRGAYREMFRETWDDLNAKRGYGWDVNPWVWVVSFDVLSSEGTDP